MGYVLLQKNLSSLLVFLTVINISYAQQTGLKGTIVDATTNEVLVDVTITIEGTVLTTLTNIFGAFDFGNKILPVGEQIAVIAKEGYITKRFPISINQGTVLDIQTIDLEYDIYQEQLAIGTIHLSDHEIAEGATTISFVTPGILQASRDVFLSAAAFDFSSTFFRPRGLDSENGKVLINGIEMNKLSNGRPQWSNWGGLNDVQRTQEFTMGIAANEYTFGDLSGTTHINMRASQYKAGGRISYAASNRSYTTRMMASYSSGLMNNGWAYTISLARRIGKEGYIDGTVYDATAFFAAIEKKINTKHSLNLTGFYTANRRGKSTGITKEVFTLKGRTYNPNWGYFNGEKKNARIKKIEEPVFMLNHYWNINDHTTIYTNIGFQTGTIATSRLDNGGTDQLSFNEQETYIGGGRSRDTNPMHPANLPSFYLRDAHPTPLDFQHAFLAEQSFITNGQLDWNQLITTNQSNTLQGKNATYILYQDRTDDTQWTINTIINSQLNDHIAIQGSLSYRNLYSDKYAEVLDLLGGSGFLDVDGFALDNIQLTTEALADRAQSDLQNRNRIVGIGDRYDYNYLIKANTMDGFAQAQFTYNPIDFFIGTKMSTTSYQREGLYQNGYFPEHSFGKGSKLTFTNYGIKGGTIFKLSGRHQLVIHGTYFTKAPNIHNAYVNARQNNLTVGDIVGGKQENEKIHAIDASYNIRTPKLTARFTGYYTKSKDATDIGFFFTNAISGAFVQEIVTDIDTQYIGTELGIKYQITPTVALKASAALGQFTYDNNPDLTLTSTSEGFINITTEGAGSIDPTPKSFGKSFLKGYRIAGGPQQATQIGFEYRAPNFWWISATTNYFSNAYIDISPLLRTENFSVDPDTQIPFNNYDPIIARELVRQEQLTDYFLVNAVGGKSWRIKNYTIGFFATINNILNQNYRTGGFEQARNADYRTALEESKRTVPVFGPRYFYGFGTSYFLNIYLKF